MIVGRSSALGHFRADDRLVVIVVAVNEDPRDSFVLALLRRFRPRRLLLIVNLDRVAESADRMRQFGLGRRLRDNLRRISSAFLAGARDNSVVTVRGGQQSRRRAAGVLISLVADQRVRERRDLVGGRERRSIDLLDPRFWTADRVARSRLAGEAHFAAGRCFESVQPVAPRRASR